ncbi:MAG: hypothetical protein ACOYN5_14805, partial [Bacteroidales bacterium]
MKTRMLVLFCVSFLLVLACRKDGNDEPKTNLMTNAVVYEGDYPEPAFVSFAEDFGLVKIEAYPGFITAFFDPSLAEADAETMITEVGGTVRSKIPSLGYYLIESSPAITGNVINDLQVNSELDYACPKVVVHLSAMVLDGCGSGVQDGEDHALKVIKNLEDCGGAFETCDGIINSSGDVVEDYILHGMIQDIQSKPNGPILINISASGGLNDASWPNQSANDRGFYERSWYYFMRDLLHIIGGLDNTYRSRLVVSVASGNGNMPITNMLAQLRVDPMNAQILEENILLVSNKADTTSTMGGNYAPYDPDVVVLDNPDAASGTSFAAPCALGIIQDVIDSQGVTTAEALKAVKLASASDGERLVDPTVVVATLNLIHGQTEYKGNSTTLAFEVVTGPCVGMITFVNVPTIYWNGSSGTMIMPSDCRVTLISGDNCYINGSDHDAKVFQFNLSGSNSSFSGTGTMPFTLGSGSVPIVAAFTGAVNILGDVSGTLTLTA